MYVDDAGAVVKYNLVFIHFGLCHRDNGRVLGYDNAHGHHERHSMGSVASVDFMSYERTLRVRLCEVAREKPRSITELAAVLQRDRKAVHRDVQALHAVGMLLLRKEPKPGHGQVQVVTAAASRFQLVAEV